MTTAPWPAPHADGPVHATIRLPGSKSQTNRALVLSALARSTSTLVAPLVSRDTSLMADGVRALGVEVAEREGEWQVTPHPLAGKARVDVGNAGTVMRFLPPVAALATGDVTFDGDPRARQRPIAPVVRALRDLGANHCSGRDLVLLALGEAALRRGGRRYVASIRALPGREGADRHHVTCVDMDGIGVGTPRRGRHFGVLRARARAVRIACHMVCLRRSVSAGHIGPR